MEIPRCFTCFVLGCALHFAQSRSLSAPKAEPDVCFVQDRGRCYGLTFRGTPMIENAQLMHLLSEFVGDAGILSGRVKCGVAPGNTGQV